MPIIHDIKYEVMTGEQVKEEYSFDQGEEVKNIVALDGQYDTVGSMNVVLDPQTLTLMEHPHTLKQQVDPNEVRNSFEVVE